MKASDSTNSLTGLTDPVKISFDDPSCFICLEILNEKQEPLVDSSLLRTCGCHFKVHPECWNDWMKDKTEYDCPICRKKSLLTNKSPTPLPPSSDWPDIQNRRRFYIKVFLFCMAVAATILLIIKILKS